MPFEMGDESANPKPNRTEPDSKLELETEKRSQNSNLAPHLTDRQSAKLIFNWANCVGPLFAAEE